MAWFKRFFPQILAHSGFKEEFFFRALKPLRGWTWEGTFLKNLRKIWPSLKLGTGNPVYAKFPLKGGNLAWEKLLTGSNCIPPFKREGGNWKYSSQSIFGVVWIGGAVKTPQLGGKEPIGNPGMARISPFNRNKEPTFFQLKGPLKGENPRKVGTPVCRR